MGKFYIGIENRNFNLAQIAACVILSTLKKEEHSIEFMHIKRQEMLGMCDAWLGVGGEWNPVNYRIDPAASPLIRTGNIPYGLAGLTWHQLGMELIQLLIRDGDIEPQNEKIKLFAKVHTLIDMRLMRSIDAEEDLERKTTDKAKVIGLEAMLADKQSYLTLYDCVGVLNPPMYNYNAMNDTALDAAKDFEKAFINVIVFFRNLLCHWIANAYAFAKGDREQEFVKDAYADRGFESILVLDQRIVNWQNILLEVIKDCDINFVIMPDRGSWRIYTVPKEPGTTVARLPFPKEWCEWRKHGDQFAKEIGVVGSTFVHPQGTMAGAKTLNAAVEVAEKALRSYLPRSEPTAATEATTATESATEAPGHA